MRKKHLRITDKDKFFGFLGCIALSLVIIFVGYYVLENPAEFSTIYAYHYGK